MTEANKNFDRIATELAEVGRFLAKSGWSPATSSNYSARLSEDRIAISRTGVNKFTMTPSDVIVVNARGEVVELQSERASAETLIHTTIYAERPDAQCVLHTHSPENTRLSMLLAEDGILIFEGYELQKGFEGVKTHATTERVPILPNAQDMKAFAMDVYGLLQREHTIHGFLIAGHGLYTWASDIATARRHIETYEFLFKCKCLELMGV